MSAPISGTSSSQLARIFQRVILNGLGGLGGTNTLNPTTTETDILSAMAAASNTAVNSPNGATTGNSAGLASPLAGLNGSNSGLLAAILSQTGATNGSTAASAASAPAQPTASGQMQKLLDDMFNNASGGTGQMNLSQFTGLINQMDPNGTSGVNAAQLFGQLDPNNTGYVTQARFDAALNGTAGGTNASAITSAFSGLLDAMFNNADANGIGQLNITQFTNLVNQMDPNGTSGVDPNILFSALDPNQTGYVSQGMFDAAIQGIQGSQSQVASSTSTATAPATTTGSTSNANPLAGALSQSAMQAIFQYQMNSTLLNSFAGTSSNNNGINSLFNLTI